MAEAAARLEVRDLACIRGERPVFSGVSFALEAGVALLLHGPNGSGKSSLLRILAGLLKPADGAVMWNGEDVRRMAEDYRAQTHFVGHLDAIKPTMTVVEHLEFWAALRGARAVAPDALARLDLALLAELPGRFLSAGQRRRLALARLLSSPPEIWLLDEPTVTLDSANTARLEAIMAEHRAAGGIVVAATHTALALDGAQTLDMAAHAVPVEALIGEHSAGAETEQQDLEYDAW